MMHSTGSLDELLICLEAPRGVWDGDHVSKPDRERLIDEGMLTRHQGRTFITSKGVLLCLRSPRFWLHWLKRHHDRRRGRVPSSWIWPA